MRCPCGKISGDDGPSNRVGHDGTDLGLPDDLAETRRLEAFFQSPNTAEQRSGRKLVAHRDAAPTDKRRPPQEKGPGVAQTGADPQVGQEDGVGH